MKYIEKKCLTDYFLKQPRNKAFKINDVVFIKLDQETYEDFINNFLKNKLSEIVDNAKFLLYNGVDMYFKNYSSEDFETYEYIFTNSIDKIEEDMLDFLEHYEDFVDYQKGGCEVYVYKKDNIERVKVTKVEKLESELSKIINPSKRKY